MNYTKSFTTFVKETSVSSSLKRGCNFYAIFLIFTQRFSVGHFWSPFHAATERFFTNRPQMPRTQLVTDIERQSITKSLIFTQLGEFRPQYTTIQQPRCWVLFKGYKAVQINDLWCFLFFCPYSLLFVRISSSY